MGVCPECNVGVSNTAKACPECGCPLDPRVGVSAEHSKIPSQGELPAQRPVERPPVNEANEILLAGQITPSLGNVVGGLLFGAIGVYCAFSFLPAHSPDRARQLEIQFASGVLALDPGQSFQAYAEAQNLWYINDGPDGLFMGMAWGLVVIGVAGVIAGVFHKNRKLVYCATCRGRVAALRKRFETRCDHCQRQIGVNVAAVVLWGLLALFLAYSLLGAIAGAIFR